MSKKKLSAVGLGTILLAVSSLFSRFLGVFRDYVFAKIFGVGSGGGAFALDAYFAAFRIPDLIYTLLVFGAMSAAFIPIYTKLIKEPKRASAFASKVLNGILIMLLVISSVIWIFTPQLVPLLAPGFTEELLATTVELTRIMLLSPIFLGMSSVFQGIENSHKKFVGIALAPIVYNLSIIIAALIFGSEFGVYALAWGVVLGAFLHFSVQVPGALRTSYKYSWNWNLKSKEMKEFIILTIPRLFGISVAQISIFIDTIIASFLVAGSLSIFNYSLNLQSLPAGVVAVSFSVAVFSTLSEQSDNKEIFVSTLKNAIHSILFWVVPAVVGLFVLSNLIVKKLLLGGAFDYDAYLMTTLTLMIFLWAALGQSMTPIFARAFYSQHETKIPVLIAFVTVIVNTIISLVLTKIYGFGVYALAISALVSSSLQAVLLVIFLASFMEVKVMSFFIFDKLVAILLSVTAMVFVIYPLRNAMDDSWLSLGVISVSGFLVYMLVAKSMKAIPSLRGS